MILGVDTSSKTGSVALVDGGRVVDELQSDSPASFSRLLLAMVETILAKNGLTLRSLDAIAAATGPGSFTGIRIGLATVEGIALARGVPAIGISTLEAIARASGKDGAIVPATDAGNGNAYYARFERHGGALRRVTGDAMGRIEDVRRAENPASIHEANAPRECSVAAGAALCAAELLRTHGAPAAALKPNYVQKSAAERTANP